ncbi:MULTISPECIES: outer membrane beta-barrel protein [Rhodomicrobium]|uniref:outer membrane protein n=1 Tax=Rhodomicrobium TaxID=1068 RepID=UPI000B4B11B1|nr:MULTISPECIES: outer membrane beta-barrel protein [Rhodomicrobium]
MKTALLGAALLVGAAASASAADLGRGSYKDAPGEYLPAITWSGLYFGVNAGAAFNDDDDNDRRFSDVRDFGDNDGDDTIFLGGVHLGYNWQRSNGLVLGVEGDVSFGDDIDYLGSVRARLGYAEGATLFYATGGWAFLGQDDNFGDDDTLDGFVVGLGVDHKIAQNVSVGLEGLYYNFGEQDFSDEDQDFWSVRARLTYHLGGDAYQDALK